MMHKSQTALTLLLGALLVLIAAVRTPTAGGDHGQVPADTTLAVITFTAAGGATVTLAVEVADDFLEMVCGLMHRTSLPEAQGMLFAYREDGQLGGFWMRNTLIPLALAYIAGDGRIVDIVEMEPVPAPGFTPYVTADGAFINVPDGELPPEGARIRTHPPRAPYQYAIEVNQGWFARHGLAIGDYADLSEALVRAAQAAPPLICADRGL